MKLPNRHRALVDLQKIRDYCLSSAHPRGRHKARVLKLGDATIGRQDDYGVRYMLDFTIAGPGGEGIIRSHWIVRRGEDFPRLTSCHVR